MKKILALILTALSCVLCLPACSANETTGKKTKGDEDLLWEETLLDDWYLAGDDIIFRVLLNSEEDVYEKITYSVNNFEEVEASVVTGKVSDSKQDIGGTFYVDTGAEIIPSEELGVGAFVVVFYAYDDDDNKIQINDQPIVFQIKKSK